MRASSAVRRVIGLVNAASKCLMRVENKTMLTGGLVVVVVVEAAADAVLDPDPDRDRDPAEDQGRSAIFNSNTQIS